VEHHCREDDVDVLGSHPESPRLRARRVLGGVIGLGQKADQLLAAIRKSVNF
jgi:hypothetical protein